MVDKYTDLINKARELRQVGKREEAIKVYEEAFKEKAMLGDIVCLALLYIEIGELTKSLSILNRLKEDNIDDGVIDFCYGEIYKRLGNKEEAKINYEKAIKRIEDVDVYFGYADLLDEEEDFEKAIKYYEKTIKLDKNYYWAYVNLSSIYERQELYEKSLEYSKKAYDIDNTLPISSYNMGVANSKLGNIKDAISCYLEETNKKDGFYLAFFNLAILYKDNKEYDKARMYNIIGIEKLHDKYVGNKEKEANYYSLWYNLGCVYALMKDYDNANDCFTYIYYKKKKILDGFFEDEELKEYIESKEYQKIASLMEGMRR